MRAGTTFAALQPGALRIIEATAIPGAHPRFGRVDPALLTLVVPRFAAGQLAALDALSDTRLLTRLAAGFECVVIRFGFMEELDIPAGLALAKSCVPSSDYIGHETVVASARVQGMAPWREELFVAMQRNTTSTGTSFCIPTRQAVEVGTEIVI